MKVNLVRSWLWLLEIPCTLSSDLASDYKFLDASIQPGGGISCQNCMKTACNTYGIQHKPFHTALVKSGVSISRPVTSLDFLPRFQASSKLLAASQAEIYLGWKSNRCFKSVQRFKRKGQLFEWKRMALIHISLLPTGCSIFLKVSLDPFVLRHAQNKKFCSQAFYKCHYH